MLDVVLNLLLTGLFLNAQAQPVNTDFSASLPLAADRQSEVKPVPQRNFSSDSLGVKVNYLNTPTKFGLPQHAY